MQNMYIFMKRNFIFFDVFQSTVWSQSYCRTGIIDYSLEQQLDWYIDCILSCIHTTNAQLTHSFTGLLPIINIKIKKEKKKKRKKR